MSWRSGWVEFLRSRGAMLRAWTRDRALRFRSTMAGDSLEDGTLLLYGEINFLASPTREVSSSIRTATHDFASLYLTPGIRLKFLPTSRISPYTVAGGGYADYEQSTTRIDGQANTVPRQLARGVFDFGAGVDVRIWRFVALRGEARDFFTGSPAYNIRAISGGQHNVVATGGFVLRWH